MKFHVYLMIVLVLISSLFCFDVKGSDNFNDELGKITISATAKLNIVPDEVSISLGIENFNVSLKRSRSLTKTRLDNLVKALKGLGLEEKQIEYGHIRINPKYPEYREGKNIIGYNTSISIIVRLNDFEKISSVVDTAVENGITELSDFNFYSTKMPEYKKKVRTMAIEAAKEKVKQYEKEMKISVGRVLSISEGSPGYFSSTYNNMVQTQSYASAGSDYDQTEPISPGDIPLTLNVNCVYEIEK